ncbi:T9SS type A sorting domain-containing protein [Hymenobacter coalescens]
MAPDAAGNVFVCGRFGNKGGDNQNHTGVFGPLTLSTTGNSGYSDSYVAKYDAQGGFQWVRTLRGADTEWARAVAVNQRGEVYLSGAAYGGVQFETTTLTANTFGYQGYVAKYSATGDLRWLQGYGGSGTPFGGSNLYAGLGLATDGAGHLYVAGAFMGNTYFGNFYESGPNQGVNYPYIAALDDLEVVTATAPVRPDLVSLAAYPNPSTGQVQLRWPAAPRPLPLMVLDALGRTVHTATLPTATTTATLQLGHLPKGVYVLRLTNGAQVMTRRLVLQ